MYVPFPLSVSVLFLSYVVPFHSYSPNVAPFSTSSVILSLFVNVTVAVYGSHFAYRVMFPVGVYGLGMLSPVPSAFVFHPLNVYPVLYGLGGVTLPSVQLAYIDTTAPCVSLKFVTSC